MPVLLPAKRFGARWASARYTFAPNDAQLAIAAPDVNTYVQSAHESCTFWNQNLKGNVIMVISRIEKTMKNMKVSILF